jgi:hypothetical protein
MKKKIYSLLAGLFVLGIVSCNNGDYIADPQSNGNGAVNPVTPLTSKEFTWGNNDVLSADINGSNWKADSVTFGLDTSGANVIMGYKKQSDIILQLYLRDVWGPDNVYPIEWENYSRYGAVTDKTSLTEGTYFSYLGNSGGLKMTYNDTDAIKGVFYFKAVTLTGKVMNVSNGVLNYKKM